MLTAAAGSGSRASRMATSAATVRPPPAESPAMAMRPAAIFLSSTSQRYAATASSTAAGNACSGASRYSGSRQAMPADRAMASARWRCDRDEPIT